MAMFDLLFPKWWSTLKKLIWLKAAALSSAVVKTVTAAIVHIKDALAGPAQNVTIAIEPVQAGSGDPSPDNVRPITGWTGCNITRTGANICGGTALNEEIQSHKTRTFDPTNRYVDISAAASGILVDGIFKANTQYTFIWTMYKTAGTGWNIVVVYTDGSYTLFGQASATQTKETKVFVSAASKTIKHVEVYNQSGHTYLYVDESGIFEGVLTKDDFEAYNGTTIPITFGSAGTVYGGKLDVVNGVLTVDRKKATGTWGATGGTNLGSVTRKSFSLGEYVKAESQGFIPTSSVAKWNRNYMSDTVHFYTDGTQLLLFLPNDTPADTSFEVVYWPATPQTYQLTAHQIDLLAGENSLWSDTGNTTLTYLADGKADDVEALNILLAGRYVNHGAADEATDAEALDILLGGNR